MSEANVQKESALRSNPAAVSSRLLEKVAARACESRETPPAVAARDGFETALVEALQPIRNYVLACAIHHLFESGLFDVLAFTARGMELRALADSLKADEQKLAALLSYLRNEGLLKLGKNYYSLTDKAMALKPFRPWYTMLIGGYGQTFLQLGEKLGEASGPASRNAMKVGVGSCGISHYDAIPLTRKLMAKAPGQCRRLLDMGCGNGLYLVEFCRALSGIEAWGVEPDPAGSEAARMLVQQAGFSERIHISCCSAQSFFESVYRSRESWTPDFAVLGFVLHEILGQDGPEGVKKFLRQLTERFPDIQLIVIEVDNRFDDPKSMRHGLALGYYNAYYLFHPFTRQRLEKAEFWQALFEQSGLELLASETTSSEADSTGLELGYLLRRRR